MQELLSRFNDLDDELKAGLFSFGRIVLILLLAWVVQAAIARIIRTFRDYAERRGGPDEGRRIATLTQVFRYSATVVLAVVAGTLVLSELGIAVAPILATAGVAGVAIGFGAQSLIRDYLTGFFLLLEDQIRYGDVVAVGGKEGQIEEMTLRYVRLRDFEGHVHFVPNGEIKTVTNRTREFATAVIEVGVGYREDADVALGLMREVGATMRADPQWTWRLVDDAEIIGVEAWGEVSVLLRCRLKVVPPIEQWNVKREFLKRLKKAYAAKGIEIPSPQLKLVRQPATATR